MDHFDGISVEDLHNALDNVGGNKLTQRLLAAIVYKTASRKPNLPSGTELDGERSTAGSSDSSVLSRSSQPSLMLIGLGEAVLSYLTSHVEELSFCECGAGSERSI